VKLTIEPTSEFERIDGRMCRVWTGTDENGTPVRASIAVVQPQTHDESLLADFEANLKALPRPHRRIAITDLRFADEEAAP
jgi:hypothetical protein